MFNSKKQLAVYLSKLRPFVQPKILLEQYATDSEVAASVVWDAHMLGDIEGKHIVDLGCGTGILGIGCLLMGASKVSFVEIDPDAMKILNENLATLEETEGPGFVFHTYRQQVVEFLGHANVVIQNPPFGTRTKHADLRFLGEAVRIAPVVYSLHKTSTKDHLLRWAQTNSLDLRIWDFSFMLKQTMKQHTRKIHRIEVSCLRLSKRE